MTKLVHETGFAFGFTDHVRDVCRPGDGARTCRYLTGELPMFGGGSGLHCARFYPALAARIDERVAEGTMVAQAINCPGKPYEAVL